MGRFPAYLASCASRARYFGSVAEMKTPFDMVIIGGGMVGLGLAALTSASPILQNKRVLLLEGAPQKPYQMKETYEPRTVALNATSRNMLESLGAWDFIVSNRVQPVHKMVIWENQSDSFLIFERQPLAHIVENALVTEALKLAALRQTQADLTVMYGARTTNIQLPPADRPDQLVSLQVEFTNSPDKKVFETPLLVGADGISSMVRKVTGLRTVSWDHGQSAVVASLCIDENNEEFTAWQRFTSTGPIALLPLSARHSYLIWSTTNAEAERLMGVPDEQFVGELNEALTCPSPPIATSVSVLTYLGQLAVKAVDLICGRSDSASPNRPDPPHISGLQPNTVRSRYPLGFMHANSYHIPRVALVGDAAHRILPLAGQGVNLGFGDVISLVQHLENAVSHGADIGSAAYLSEYTTERQRAVVPVAAVMEALNLLYSTDAMTSKVFNVPGHPGATEQFALLQLCARLVTGLRAAGLRSVQSSALLKNILIDSAVNGRIGLPNSFS